MFDSPKGSGIWYAQVTTPEGKQIQRKGPSLKEAQAKRKELLAMIAGHVNLAEKEPTLWQWWQLWLDQFAGNLKPHIREDYRGIGRRYVEPQKLGKTRLRSLTFAQVQAWVNELAKTLQPQTVKNAHARLRKALKVAMRKGYVDKNVAEGVKPPSAGQVEAADLVEIRPYTFAQVLALLTRLRGNRWYALHRLAINLGLRQAELLGLTWDCVDLERGTITVQQQLRRVGEKGAEKGAAKTWQLLPPKTASAKRTLRLDPDLIEVLREHRKNLLEERLLHGKDWQNRDPWRKRGGLVFVTETGAPIHGSDLLQHFHRWAKKAEVPLVRFHDLRHTAATLMIADGRSVPAISKVLGHANPGIRMRIYAHAYDDAQADAIGGLSRKLAAG